MSIVTFLLPVFNGEKYLAECLESLQKQTYEDFEALVINDGSTDATQEIIDEFVTNDKRFRCISRENRGLISSLNEGIELIETKYIARMDADDLCDPKRLELQLKFLEENPDIGLVGADMRIFGDVDKDLHYPETHEEIKATMIFATPFSHPAVIFRKEIFIQSNIRYDKHFVDCEDYKIWFDLLDVTKMANLPNILIYNRRHGNSVSDRSTTQHKGCQLIRRLAVKKFGLLEESVLFHLDFTDGRYEKMKLEYWPCYLLGLKEIGPEFFKVGIVNFKFFCKKVLPEDLGRDFFDCVIKTVIPQNNLECIMR